MTSTQAYPNSSTSLAQKHSNEDFEQNYHCRICLDQEPTLLSLPCDCRGQIGKVHMKCFSKWIQKKQQAFLKQEIITHKCEICNKTIKIEVKTKMGIKSCRNISEDNRCCQVFGAVITIVVICFLMYLCIRGIIDNAQNAGYFIMFIVYGFVIIFLLVVLKVVIQLALRIFRKRSILSMKFIVQPSQTYDLPKNNSRNN